MTDYGFTARSGIKQLAPMNEGRAGHRLSTAELTQLADDAFTVLNWARRLGFNRERQIEKVRKAFEVTLGYRKPVQAGGDDAG